MKRNLLTAAICLIIGVLVSPRSAAAETAASVVKVDEANFPDANFRKYIQTQLNECNSGKSPLPYDAATQTINTEVKDVTIDCRGLNIYSLKGVEWFKSIENLSCANNHLLSVSVNPDINYLRFANIGELNGANPEQTRTVTSQTVNLKDLDSDFNPARVKNLNGAEWVNENEGIIKLNDGVTTATYEYRCLSVDPADTDKDKYYMDVKLTLDVEVPLDEAHFPDAHFRECLKTAINTESGNNNAYDSQTNTIRVADVKVLNCNEKGIKSLKGIELFPNLGMFFCKANNLIAFKPHPKSDIWNYDFNGQSYDIGNNTSVNLATVDSAFDPTKLTDLEGAELNGTTLSFGEHSFEATYTYHPIDGHPERTMSVEITRYADGIEISVTDFPDEYLRKFLQEDPSMKKYLKEDGKISLGINEIEIDWHYDDITSLKGIEKFIHLQILNINDRKVGKSLQTVNLPKSLIHLYCANVKDLTEISNLDELTNLESLNISNNASLKTLDVTNNTKLKKLSCGSDGGAGHETILESLTLPSDPSLLEELDCSRTKLTELNLSNCTGLKFLKINFARGLKSLTLPVGPSGTNNQVQKITCDNCNLSTLDLSKCALLRRLECSNNVLTELDLSACAVLDTLDCGNPLAYSDSEFNDFKRKKLDLSHNLTLKWLECMNLNISELDLSKHSQLEYINCGLNLKEENIKKGDTFKFTLPTSAPNLRTLNCGNNGLTDELDNIKIYKELRIIECADNQIEHLNVSENTNLFYLYARVNKLTELDVTKNPHLTHLTCSYNPLGELDVTKNPHLTSLNCNDNKLEVLELSNNTQLDTLHVENNSLIALDLTKQTGLFDIKLNNQRRRLGTGRHFNMNRRDGHYDGSNVQDTHYVVLSSTFTDYDIDTTQDDANFPSELSAQSETGDGTQPDNSTLTQWMTFDSGKAEATYNYRTGGIYNDNLATDPDKPTQPKGASRKSKPFRAQSVPEVYEGTTGDGDRIKYALMDVTITRVGPVTGIDEVVKETTATRIRAEHGAAIIDGAEGRIAVYTTAGILAAAATATDGFSTRIPLPAGLYMVITSTSTAKILVP